MGSFDCFILLLGVSKILLQVVLLIAEPNLNGAFDHDHVLIAHHQPSIAKAHFVVETWRIVRAVRQDSRLLQKRDFGSHNLEIRGAVAELGRPLRERLAKRLGVRGGERLKRGQLLLDGRLVKPQARRGFLG